MEPLDASKSRFDELRSEIEGYVKTIVTEQDTRLKAIDRLLVEVLGWDLADISTEDRAGTGYVDYILSLDGLPRVVVEAKRDGISFDLTGDSGRPYKLDGPMFASKESRSGLEQAIGYCAHKSVELAVVTNGREWIIFRGSRAGDGIPVLEGRGFIFPSLDGVADQYKLFWELLAPDGVADERFRAHFLEAEGAPIRSVSFSQAVYLPHEARPLKPSELYGDMRGIMTRFFTRLSGDDDPDMLVKCFVESRESRDADRTLARISEDLIGKIRSVNDTDTAEQLVELIKTSVSSDSRSFTIIVGTKGAGKSTFIERFFKVVLPDELRRQTVSARVDLRSHTGDIEGLVSWLNKELVTRLEEAIGEDLDYDEILGMFYDEYTRLKRGPWKHLYERGDDSFRIQFGEMIERKRSESPRDYIAGLFRHIVANRRLLPLVTFDNADHFTIEYQEAVYQYARAIHAQSGAMVILPVTDRTSWQLSDHGALRSFEHEALHLPTPPMQAVLAKRIEYLSEKLEHDSAEPGQYTIGPGVRLSVRDLNKFVAAIERVLISQRFVPQWLSALANGDVRRSLQLTSDVVSSPHVRIEGILGAAVIKERDSIKPHDVRAAFIKDKYQVYPMERHGFVQNVFHLSSDVDTTPLLGVRILRLLDDAPRDEHAGAFLSVDTVVSYFSGLHISRSAVLAWLDSMLKTGLCWAYDPTIETIYRARQVELTPSGALHLEMGTALDDYVGAMAQVTPLRDRATHRALRQFEDKREAVAWFQRIEAFVEYLVSEDSKYANVPGHAAYEGQVQIVDTLRRLASSSRRSGEDRLKMRRTT